MAFASGLSAQLGTAEESTYGTPVTVDKFFEFRNETLKLDVGRIDSQGLRAGQLVLRNDRWATGKRSVSGDVLLELSNKSFGRWFKHALGTVATSQPDSVGNPTVYLHTFTPGELPTAQTIQVGRPDVSATVRPFTYHGCKVASWELACAVDDIVTFKPSILGEDEDTSTGLAVASYPSSLALMTFVQGTLTIAATAADIKSVSLTGNNGLADGRYFMGSALRKNPISAAMRAYGGQFSAEFESLTAYNRYVNGTEADVVLLFQGATISTTYKYQLQVTAHVRFDGETPNVGGPDVVGLNLPFKVLDDGTKSIKLEYQTTDTTP